MAKSPHRGAYVIAEHSAKEQAREELASCAFGLSGCEGESWAIHASQNRVGRSEKSPLRNGDSEAVLHHIQSQRERAHNA